MIKRFKITNLFGFRIVDILFENDIKILIGENGLGKTTVLNSLYYLLNQMYYKLAQVNFENIELELEKNIKIKFSKFELIDYLEFQENKKRNRRRFPSRIENILDNLNIQQSLKNDIKGTDRPSINDRKRIEEFIKDNDIPTFASSSMMVREIFSYIKEPTFEKFDFFNDILNNLNLSILYFPTYRRVEEDLKNLGNYQRETVNRHSHRYIDEFDEEMDVSEDTLIHFGMEDVEARILNIQNKINKSTIIGFSKVTGEMLSQLLEGFQNVEDKTIDLDVETVKIILHRVGDNLKERDRQKILNLLDSPESLKEKKELVYFIYKLIDIYEEHKHLDDAVKNFCKVCNEYLGDKEFKYNESSVDIDIYRVGSETPIQLNNLSSGEKQIISIFSKIYLENTNNLIVLFDEPELSLSITWQERLLPDIINSEKCQFLLSVTHSPFVFENELDKYAVGMSTYISELINE